MSVERSSTAARQFLHDGAAVIHEVGRHTVNGFTLPPPQRIILKAGRDTGAAEADELVAGVPGVGDRA